MGNSNITDFAREKLKETLEGLKKRNFSIYLKNNPYGYKININHPNVHPKWVRFKELWELGNIETELPLYDDTARRIVFEEVFMQSSLFKKLLSAELKRYGKESFELLTGLSADEVENDKL